MLEDPAAPAAQDPGQSREPQSRAPQSRALVLPEFTPVPRLVKRHNGWNPEVQRRFIEALADTGSVTSACRAVRRSDHGAYLLRRHPEAEEFRRAWDAALDLGVRRIEDGVMDRAINGVQVPIHSGNQVVGYRTVHNERLTTFILQNRAPERFGGLRQGLDGSGGAKGPNAVDKMELNRLKKQWRAEWRRQWEEEHQVASAALDRECADELAEMIEARHVTWWSHLSPRAREAYLTFRQIESEEAANWRGEAPLGEDESRIALAHYEEVFAHDPRAKVDLMIEADGLADELVLGEDMPPPPPGREITLRNEGWYARGPGGNDGRAKGWP